MLHVNILDAKYIKNITYAQIGVGMAATILCCYMGFNTFLGINQVHEIKGALNQAKTESAELSRQASTELRREAKQSALDNGGVDAFAVRLSGWAKNYQISIESITPEGAPAQSQIANGTTKLGTWNASKVRIKGRGDFLKLISLLKEIKNTRSPAKLESYIIEASNGVKFGIVSFDLVVTVYEKKTGESSGA